MTPANPALTVYAAGWLLAPEGETRAGGGIAVARGRVVALLRSRSAVKRAARAGRLVDLGPGLLAPAFVDAHAHLELTGLSGSTPRTQSFASWIQAVIAARAARTGRLVEDARRGAERLLSTGTTLVGDIDSSGAIERALDQVQLRVRRYREVLDAGDPARAASALARLDRPDRPGRRRPNLLEGLSPHAPYSVSRALWHALGQRSRAHRSQVAIHWAETREEVEWLEHARGPLAGILSVSPREPGLDTIEHAGLLGPRTALIHGNHATSEERLRVAGSGASLVHCPGTHAFFGRERFDAAGWLAAGVNLALGTDSMASNEDLDMGRETALFATRHPELAPRSVLDCATLNGARALGLAGRAGTLAPGARADFLVYEARPAAGAERAGGAALLAALVHAGGRLAAVFAAGRRVAAAPVVENAGPGSESFVPGPQ